ncbi:2-amino-4-hydroxy-6-hydroxymethyldihydropteridine diphosphokinase [Desulfoscipio geothermicus]|uniref:2-amino-4-hydroxy-6-hydroxymethyldihydropteridine diphosphokinase n=1 Tax=Desulfoscipio geothermicus DSM 3669 TaxID=1121426 RepID=A0A1I6DUI2_9FIRM|nr:2-amino-4-hydroxy-6-hydroxymethyldihydropteridine diphosphokinase [Desulfoscipio geothermicus]SFR09105.1 2-amino-4-hydroxy-6-hydroxymethyldihydropteridinediphosphokinase [Desulfoscipio geothermicus DSM 3669]
MTGHEVRCYIGLGSNLGDSLENIRQALRQLADTEGVAVMAVAPFYRTAPVGYADQNYFINTVAEIHTILAPRQLLKRLQEIENKLGRVRVIRWGPRTVDLDILLYGNQIINEPDLEIPHSRMHQRAFVMIPLADLNPGLEVAGEKAVTLARRLAGEQEIEKLYCKIDHVWCKNKRKS